MTDLAQTCGHLIVGGFDGPALSDEQKGALASGHSAGAILFKRNLVHHGDSLAIEHLAELNATIAAAVREPPFICVDQEGGRVARLGPPVVQLPPAREFGQRDDVEHTRASAAALGRQLAALGFNVDFAPVCDVDSNPGNPVIGDRSFGRDARTAMRHAVAFLRGLQSAGVAACAKHFPGHGDTAQDSHRDLPVVDRPLPELAEVELPPFRAASGAGVAAMMTAHVVYSALNDSALDARLDPTAPRASARSDATATFSRAVCTDLLREQIGFEGVLFSDDLEMGAIAKHGSMQDAAVRAVAAGCDVVLVCSDFAAQARAHEALVRRAEADSTFAARCRQAAERSLRLRRARPPSPERDPGRLRAIFKNPS